ncbi:MAG: hypothetical protein U0414_01890 [Polyangiaceae bacterium]
MRKTTAWVAVLLMGCGSGEASTTGGSASATSAKPAPTTSAKPSAAPSASVAAAKPVEVPPGENPKVELIPDAPVKGEIKGEAFEGVIQAFYSTGSQKLEFGFRDKLDAAKPCDDRDYDHKIRLEFAKDTYAVGKPKSGALGKNPDIAVDKIYAGYGTGGPKGYWSNPGLTEIAYAIDIQSFEPPADAKSNGKIKVKLAVRIPGEKLTWFTGTYDGPVCGR